MEGKRAEDSMITMSQIMIPQDANPAGNVHGGVVVKIIDEAAGVVASRHARCNVVTASIDRMDFHYPIFVGDVLFCKARLNFVGKTSMEIGARVEAENLMTGEVRHAASAYLTYVAIDEHGKPKEVPRLILETEADRQRYREAAIRRNIRLDEKKRKEECRKNPEKCA